jgi:hypothetical protein
MSGGLAALEERDVALLAEVDLIDERPFAA